MLNFIMTQLRVPQAMSETVARLPLPSWAIMLVIIEFYLALGTFMEGFSMIITTIPVSVFGHSRSATTKIARRPTAMPRAAKPRWGHSLRAGGER
jgi:hypothetical protein